MNRFGSSSGYHKSEDFELILSKTIILRSESRQKWLIKAVLGRKIRFRSPLFLLTTLFDSWVVILYLRFAVHFRHQTINSNFSASKPLLKRGRPFSWFSKKLIQFPPRPQWIDWQIGICLRFTILAVWCIFQNLLLNGPPVWVLLKYSLSK